MFNSLERRDTSSIPATLSSDEDCNFISKDIVRRIQELKSKPPAAKPLKEFFSKLSKVKGPASVGLIMLDENPRPMLEIDIFWSEPLDFKSTTQGQQRNKIGELSTNLALSVDSNLDISLNWVEPTTPSHLPKALGQLARREGRKSVVIGAVQIPTLSS